MQMFEREEGLQQRQHRIVLSQVERQFAKPNPKSLAQQQITAAMQAAERADSNERVRIVRQATARHRLMNAARRSYVQAKWNLRNARRMWWALSRMTGPMTVERFDQLVEMEWAQGKWRSEMTLAGAVWLPEWNRRKAVRRAL